MVKKQKKHNNRLLCLALAVLVLVIGFLGFLTVKISTASTAGNVKEETSATNVSSQSEPEFIETSATVMSIGDIMVHSPQLNGALNSSTGD